MGRRVMTIAGAVVVALHATLIVASIGNNFGIHVVLAVMAGFAVAVALFPERVFEFYGNPGFGAWQDEPSARGYQVMRLVGALVAVLATIAAVASL